MSGDEILFFYSIEKDETGDILYACYNLEKKRKKERRKTTKFSVCRIVHTHHDREQILSSVETKFFT